MLLAFFGALIIGISLGLLGSGGSIFTLPVLVFILERPEKQAIAESLAIVGSIALIGAIPYAWRTQIHWRSVFFFGLPGIFGAYAGSYASYYISDSMHLILFALVMFAVASMMLFAPPSFDQKWVADRPNLSFTILQGFLVGCLTGFIGIGGGFLIVPALVLFNRLPMSFAIGTSLMIIAINAFTGFAEQLINLNTLNLGINGETIFLISTIGMFGSLAGGIVNQKISQLHLRMAFGVSVFVMGFFVLFSQI